MTKSRTFTVALIVVLILLAASAWLMFGRTAADMSYPDADQYTVGNTTVTKPVSNLYVDWTSGRVNIEYHDGTGVIVSETANRALSEDDMLRWWLDGDTLRIRYAKSGFRISFNLEKQLTVRLPYATELKSADISSTSGDLYIPALTADEIRLGSTSGSIDAGTVTKKLAASSTSGDVTVLQTGDLDSADLSSTSGSLSFGLEGSVKKVEANSTSGGVSVTVSGTADDLVHVNAAECVALTVKVTAERSAFGSDRRELIGGRARKPRRRCSGVDRNIISEHDIQTVEVLRLRLGGEFVELCYACKNVRIGRRSRTGEREIARGVFKMIRRIGSKGRNTRRYHYINDVISSVVSGIG